MKKSASRPKRIGLMALRKPAGKGDLAGGAVLVGVAVAVAAVMFSGLLGAPVPGAAQSGVAARPSVFGASIPAQADAATPFAAGALSPAVSPAAKSFAPLVPVVSFWSTRRDISLTNVIGLWAGLTYARAATGYETVAVADEAADPLAAAFGIPAGSAVRSISTAAVKAAVRASPTTLGLLPAADVTPDVRALSVDGVSLFGSDRTGDQSTWPLVIPPTSSNTFSLGAEWTLAAGGDVNLDRGVYVKAVTFGYGPDFPWSGGNAVVSGYQCCGWQNAPLVVANDIGPEGALRKRLADADLALVNLEGSAPDNYVYRGLDSLTFTFDPDLLVGLHDAGIDAVSLANNHIRNGGDQGVIDTCANLDEIGMPHAGAGADATAARKPAWLEARGRRVAVLGYSAVGGDNWARADRPGAAQLDPDAVKADIHAARAAGADIVIVMPHWGEEYSYSVSGEQVEEAAAFVADGADLVLGSHSHWVGGIQSIDRPQGPAFIDYSLGDFLFDLNHDVQSQEGVIATLTFSGTRLVQVGLDPTIMIDGAQVGLLDPAADGSSILDAIRAASGSRLDW